MKKFLFFFVIFMMCVLGVLSVIYLNFIETDTGIALSIINIISIIILMIVEIPLSKKI